MVKNHLNEPRYYEIRIEGHLNKTHARDLGDMSLQLLPNGQTLISGPVSDQAALFGTLIRIRDMGASLVSVKSIEKIKIDIFYKSNLIKG